MPEKEQTEELTKEQQEQIVHEKAVNEDPAEELTTLLAEKRAEEKSTDVKAEAEEGAKDDSEKEVEAEGAEEEKDEFDPEILAIAADLGMNEAKARRFKSVGDLEAELLELSEKSQAPAPTAAEQEKDEDWQSKVKKEVEPKKFRLEAGDDLDETLVTQVNAVLAGITGQYEDRSKALETNVAALTAQIQANQAAQFVQSFDAMMEKHGEPYSKEIGTGPTYDLSGKTRANREKIVNRMTVLVNAHVASNQAIPSDDNLVQSAMKDVFGGREKDNGTVEKRRAPYLRRSSSRGSQTPSTQMRARLDLSEKLAALRAGEEG